MKKNQNKKKALNDMKNKPTTKQIKKNSPPTPRNCRGYYQNKM